ncbi:unnamed protein product [Medioppia subpectinata]|uniref:Uncharacterized protein n=1 Tax=Medioppia subpectinata TaxID=1979941 RepID=A0A7R9L0M1_9ACAR|nr:unnamed protein product [Medioppia subpectinata]CAG2113171.1 unnamed protein product [Medioppia subpectinata]
MSTGFLLFPELSVQQKYSVICGFPLYVGPINAVQTILQENGQDLEHTKYVHGVLVPKLAQLLTTFENIPDTDDKDSIGPIIYGNITVKVLGYAVVTVPLTVITLSPVVGLLCIGSYTIMGSTLPTGRYRTRLLGVIFNKATMLNRFAAYIIKWFAVAQTCWVPEFPILTSNDKAIARHRRYCKKGFKIFWPSEFGDYSGTAKVTLVREGWELGVDKGDITVLHKLRTIMITLQILQ